MKRRPRNSAPFQDPQGLANAIDDYFATVANDDRPLTVPGLAVHLNMTVKTLMVYGAKPDFGDYITMALAQIEAWQAEACFDKNKVHGAKFNLDVFLNRISNEKNRMLIVGNETLAEELIKKHADLKRLTEEMYCDSVEAEYEEGEDEEPIDVLSHFEPSQFPNDGQSTTEFTQFPNDEDLPLTDTLSPVQNQDEL